MAQSSFGKISVREAAHCPSWRSHESASLRRLECFMSNLDESGSSPLHRRHQESIPPYGSRSFAISLLISLSDPDQRHCRNDGYKYDHQVQKSQPGAKGFPYIGVEVIVYGASDGSRVGHKAREFRVNLLPRGIEHVFFAGPAILTVLLLPKQDERARSEGSGS